MPPPPSPQVGIDSQCLSYVIDAFSGISAPADQPVAQKLALAGLFFYLPDTLWVTPTVTAECARIRDIARAELHASFIRTLFGEIPVQDATAASLRAADLGRYHNGVNDCLVVSEAEQVGHLVLLSLDSKLVRRLAPRTAVRLLNPSDYWDELSVPRGTKPDKVPHSTNPLSSEAWWRW